jgi:hypothetical protein
MSLHMLQKMKRSMHMNSQLQQMQQRSMHMKP